MKLYLDNCHIYITFPPSIGELHFSIFSLNSTKLFPQRFPSPIGELHFSIFFPLVFLIEMFLFPSPIGELHFSMIMARGKKLSRIRVSVPYRGATFLNQARTFSDVAKNVSVPYRGATFLNRAEITEQEVITCFRPLSGSYISQLVANSDNDIF